MAPSSKDFKSMKPTGAHKTQRDSKGGGSQKRTKSAAKIEGLKDLLFSACFTGKLISLLDEKRNLVVLDRTPFFLSSKMVGKMLGIGFKGDMVKGCFARADTDTIQGSDLYGEGSCFLNEELKIRVSFLHAMAVSALDSESNQYGDLLAAAFFEVRDRKKMNWAEELLTQSFASWRKCQGKEEIIMYDRVLRVAILDQLRKCDPKNKSWRTETRKKHGFLSNSTQRSEKHNSAARHIIKPVGLTRVSVTLSLSEVLDLCLEPLVLAQKMHLNIKDKKLDEAKSTDQLKDLKSELDKVKADCEKTVEVLNYKCCYYRHLVFLKGQEMSDLAKKLDELLKLEKSYSELMANYEKLSRSLRSEVASLNQSLAP